MKNVKSLLRNFRSWLVFQRETYLDGRRFLGASTWAGFRQEHHQGQLESALIRHYHVVEKGLSMPEFRPKFGAPLVRTLVRLVRDWRARYGEENLQYRSAVDVLKAYYLKHVESGECIDDILAPAVISEFALDDSQRALAGGVRIPVFPSPEEGAAYRKVATSRASIRRYVADKIPDEGIIGDAVEIAKWSPSVCNRQSWRVHAYRGTDIEKLLKHQQGNRGFGHQIPVLLVVTSDLRCFTGPVERYQGWIDGGMFSMALLLALHSLGLGAVPLNWSALNRTDEALRKDANIPDHERVIMLIGCGYPDDTAPIPNSCRHEVEHFLAWH
ncbi:MAG: nitroreductase family protein [Luteolibacter sp.]